MVYDPIVERQLMARQPTAAADNARVGRQCLQDSKTAREHTNNSNGVIRQRKQQMCAEHQSQMDSSTQGNRQQQQRRAEDADSDLAEHTSKLSHQQSSSSSSSSKRLEASRMLRFVGMQATFAVSAAWHLLLFFAVTGTFGWKWMWFFVAQGPLLLLEARVSRMVKAAGLRVPRLLAVVLTNLLLLVLADPLLITPVVESGVVDGCFRQARLVAREAMQQLASSVG
jgi:cation transport ATPase